MTDAAPDIEHLDVLIIGAGLSGVGAAHYVKTECPWASFAVFEARDSMGGTWDLFRYPGVRSDSDMYTLGYAFRPWDQDESIADGPAILRYIQETAAADGTDAKIRYHHRVVAANWSTDDARWQVTAQRTDTGETFQLTAGFLFSCTGYYRYDHGYQPDFPGMDRFRGQIIHPQAWPEDLDYAGKRIVVVGSGATAVTLIPNLAGAAEHVTMLQRTPTYIIALPGKNPLVNLIRKVLPGRLSGPIVRWINALMTLGSYTVSRRRPNLVKGLIRKMTEKQLPDGYDVDTHFNPPYDPWDQRLCLVPDGDLFRSISKGDASVVTDHIETFDETGIALKSGQHLDADIIVTATGLELLFIGGIEVTIDGEDIDLPNRLTYKGMMLEGVPNLALAIGYTNASWTLKCELTCQYVMRLLNHMHDTGLRQCMPVNADSSVSAEPLLGLTAGYVQRSAHLFPKQGSKFPWQVHQNYLKDYRALKMSDVDDGAMRFGNPAPAPERTPA